MPVSPRRGATVSLPTLPPLNSPTGPPLDLENALREATEDNPPAPLQPEANQPQLNGASPAQPINAADTSQKPAAAPPPKPRVCVVTLRL